MKPTLLLIALIALPLVAPAQTATNRTMPGTGPGELHAARFRQYDTNRDGRLDLKEQEAECQARAADLARRREQFEQSRQAFAKRQRQADLERFDTNKNGQLDPAELKARDRWRATRPQEAKKQHDQNGNGKLDPEEIRPAPPAKPKP